MKNLVREALEANLKLFKSRKEACEKVGNLEKAKEYQETIDEIEQKLKSES